MLPSSSAFTSAALSGAPVVVRAWVQREDTVLFGPDGLYLSEASVSFDEFAASRRALTASVLDPEGNLRPRFATDPFAPFGNELVVESGFIVGESAECVRLGTFRLQMSEDADGRVRLTGLDRSSVVAAALNEEPYVIASGTTLLDAIGDYLQAKYPGIPFVPDPSAADEAVPSTLVYEEGTASGDPWKNMRDLALLFGRELFIDAYGRAILRPVPTQTGAPCAAVYRPGELNMAISAAVRLDPAGVRNVIKVIGEGSGLTESVVATAEIDDPSDPLYAGQGSVFGRRPEIIRSSAVGTTEQAQAAADAILVQKRGVSENVSVTLAPVAQHEPGDVVAYTSDRDEVVGVFALSAWTLDAFLKSPMNIATRRLRPPASANINVRRVAAGVASATGVAKDASVLTGLAVAAGVAAGAGSAPAPTTTVKASAGAATGAGSAGNASAISGQIVNAEVASGAGAANDAKSTVKPSAGAATGAGSAPAPAPTVKPSAGAATGAGTAYDATTSTTPAYEAAVMADSPLLFWRFKETTGTSAADTSGHGNTGTYENTPLLNQTGAIGSDSASRSVRFTPADDDFVSSAYQPYGAGTQRSYECWLKRNSGANAHTIWGSSTSTLPLFRLGNNGDGPPYHVNWFPSSGSSSAQWNYAFPDTGSWHHVVLTVDDASGTGYRKARLYVDAVDLGERTGLPAYGYNAFEFTNVMRGFDGWGAEFAIFDGLLSEARVLAHYEAA